MDIKTRLPGLMSAWRYIEMPDIFEIHHEHGLHNTITRNTHTYARVFDDRWATGRLDPHTWLVKLNQGEKTLIQLEFLHGSSDVLLTLYDTRQFTLARHGLLKKHYTFTFEGADCTWTRDKSGWTCTDSQGRVLATREDTGREEGILSTVTVHETSAVPEQVIVASAWGIESAKVDGGVLSSRPPTGTRSFGFVTGGVTAVSTA